MGQIPRSTERILVMYYCSVSFIAENKLVVVVTLVFSGFLMRLSKFFKLTDRFTSIFTGRRVEFDN